MPQLATQRLGGLGVDDELELGRPLDRQVTPVRSLEDAVDEYGGAPS